MSFGTLHIKPQSSLLALPWVRLYIRSISHYEVKQVLLNKPGRSGLLPEHHVYFLLFWGAGQWRLRKSQTLTQSRFTCAAQSSEAATIPRDLESIRALNIHYRPNDSVSHYYRYKPTFLKVPSTIEFPRLWSFDSKKQSQGGRVLWHQCRGVMKEADSHGISVRVL